MDRGIREIGGDMDGKFISDPRDVRKLHLRLLGFGLISMQMQDSVPLAFGSHLDL